MNHKNTPYKFRENAPNKEIRNYLSEKGVCQWQLADRLGISIITLQKRLHYELAPVIKELYKKLIDDIANEMNTSEEIHLTNATEKVIVSVPMGNFAKKLKKQAVLHPDKIKIQYNDDGGVNAELPLDCIKIVVR